MSKWAIVVQVCQIFIGMSGQGFTTSEPKCTGALFGRLCKRMNFGLRSCGPQRSWAICRKVEMHCPRWRGALATFGSLAELYRGRIQSDTRLKPSSKIYRCQTIDAILRFRPEWIERLIRDIRETDCLRWAAAYSGKVHGTRFNNTVGTLRAIFEVGLENGLLADNPARSQGARRREEP